MGAQLPVIELVFFTSSRVKLAHAAYLCRDYDVRIIGFREKTFGANYTEPRIYDRDQLIELSYNDALERWRKAASEDRMFILEDTSVVIHALSSEREVPGVDIKYWMEGMTFERLDAELRAHENDRRATVRSDLVLHLPRDLRGEGARSYMRFSSHTNGFVVGKESVFNTNPSYPWLDNATFNKWFTVYEGGSSISTYPIETADRYDFRANAFLGMLQYLETNRRVHRKTVPEIQAGFDFGPRLFVVCGPPCAGKTTLGEYLSRKFGYYHIEASDFMYREYYRRYGAASDVKIADFAEQALKNEPDIVARQVLENIAQLSKSPTVVTGFRSPAEVEWFRRHYVGRYVIEPVFVTAEQKTRFERLVHRQRTGDSRDYDDFVRKDEQQFSMGLRELNDELSGAILHNDRTIAQYLRHFELRYSLETPPARKGHDPAQFAAQIPLEVAVLVTLDRAGSQNYFTTTEIARMIDEMKIGIPRNKNNVSRYFNQMFYPYYEVKVVAGKRKYRLSNTGRSRARLMEANADFQMGSHQ